MGIWTDFPYTNFHSQNMDFLLRLAAKLNDELDNGLTNLINAWIAANYNTLFFNASYNAETETIIFSRDEGVNS